MYDISMVQSNRKEVTMPRPKGSKNKTPRELRAEAKRLTEKAKLLEKIEKLKQK